ncbi:MAG: response regulator transcription factor [Pseudomonadota bacterium]
MAHTAKVLLVESDTALTDALRDLFTAIGEFVPIVIPDANDAAALVGKDGTIDIVLMSTPLPKGDSAKACTTMRAHGFKGPIILMRHQEGAPSPAPDNATDQITKPFRFSVLLARMRAQWRSHEQSKDALVTIGPYKFHAAARLLSLAGNADIKLTDKEAAILRHLYRANGDCVGRDTLLEEVWGYNSGVTTHTLETHIYRLRQKIEPNGGEVTLLLTDQGGYRLSK